MALRLCDVGDVGGVGGVGGEGGRVRAAAERGRAARPSRAPQWLSSGARAPRSPRQPQTARPPLPLLHRSPGSAPLRRGAPDTGSSLARPSDRAGQGAAPTQPRASRGRPGAGMPHVTS
ncbi:Protein of unknown function [Gryllus bimaculatus]|nr:Protein of unknown function [Gryllus bimaculatus]